MSEYKESVRASLQMIEDHIGHFNEFSLRFIDPKELQEMISLWRWYISHDYFRKGDPKPEFPFSNPPVPWLDGQLKGTTTPLGKDIGICISPIIQSGIMTEHAARRIMDRLKKIYQYISQEDEKANAEKKYKEKVVDKMKTREHTKYVASLREKEREKKVLEPEHIQKVTDEYLKTKKKQRKDARKQREQAEKESLRKFNEETERMKRRDGTKT
jgi:hypothetical protein